MNELVRQLSEKPYRIQANKRNASSQALKERIDLGYIHIYFEDTATEIGMRIAPGESDLSGADFGNGIGLVHLKGYLILNFERVCCSADIELQDLKGTAMLMPVSKDEYEKVITR